MKTAKENTRVKGLKQRDQLTQARMSSSPSPCYAGGTKRLRGGDELLFPCSVASTKRMRGESAEGSVDSARPFVPSSASTFSLTDLPGHLLVEILLRLPVKSAFKCKSLCKLCCSLISRHCPYTPSFTLMFQHEKFADVRTRSFQVVSDHPSLCESHKDDNFDLSFLPFFPQPINEVDYDEEFQRMLALITLEASCDNLLLCSYSGDTEDPSSACSIVHYYVCDVVARQYVELPPAPAPLRTCERDVVVGFVCAQKEMDFPFSDSSGGSRVSLDGSRYAVMCIAAVGFRDVLCEFEALIFCSWTGCWRTSVIRTHPHMLSGFLPSSRLVAFKNKLHWLTGGCVVVFDPFNDHNKFFRIIALPMTGREMHGLGVGGHRLRVASLTQDEDHDREDPALSVWELEDYDKAIWCLAFRTSLVDVIGDYTHRIVNKKTRRLVIDSHFFCVLAFHHDIRDIVYLRVGQRVIRCNMRTWTEEAMYKLHKLDLAVYFERKTLFPETAIQFVHRWSRNFTGG